MRALVAVPVICYLLAAFAHGYGSVPNADKIASASDVTSFKSSLTVTIGSWNPNLLGKFSDVFDQWTTRIEKELSDIYRQDFAGEVFVPKVIIFRESGSRVLADLCIYAVTSVLVSNLTGLSLSSTTNAKLSNATATDFSVIARKQWKLSTLPLNSGDRLPVLNAKFKVFFREYHDASSFDLAKFMDKTSSDYKRDWKSIDAKIQFGWKQKASGGMNLLSIQLLHLRVLHASLTLNGTRRKVYFVGADVQANFSVPSGSISNLRVEMEGEMYMVKGMFRLKTMNVDVKVKEIKPPAPTPTPVGLIVGVLFTVVMVAIIVVIVVLWKLQLVCHHPNITPSPNAVDQTKTPIPGMNDYSQGGFSSTYTHDDDNNSGPYDDIECPYTLPDDSYSADMTTGSTGPIIPNIPIYNDPALTPGMNGGPDIQPYNLPSPPRASGMNGGPDIQPYNLPSPPRASGGDTGPAVPAYSRPLPVPEALPEDVIPDIQPYLPLPPAEQSFEIVLDSSPYTNV